MIYVDSDVLAAHASSLHLVDGTACDPVGTVGLTATAARTSSGSTVPDRGQRVHSPTVRAACTEFFRKEPLCMLRLPYRAELKRSGARQGRGADGDASRPTASS